MLSSYRLWFCASVVSVLSVQIAPAWAQRPLKVQSDAEQAAEVEVLGHLKRHVRGKFVEQPLSKVLEEFARTADVTIRLDVKALEDASIGPEMPVTFDAADVTLRAALSAMLGQMDLTWLVKNEAVLVTTPERAGNELITKIYPVYDLVTTGQPNRRFNGYRPLIDVITATLAPTTWDEVGGPGAIHEFRVSGALIVSQTFQVHEEIGLLLNVLRRVRDDQQLTSEGKTSRLRAAKASARPHVKTVAHPAAIPATVLLRPEIYD